MLTHQCSYVLTSWLQWIVEMISEAIQAWSKVLIRLTFIPIWQSWRFDFIIFFYLIPATWFFSFVYFEKQRPEVGHFPTLSDLRSGLLSCSRTDEKPWSATRRVGENHRAGAESVSFSRVCKLLSARVDRFLEHQQVERDSSFSFFFLQACVNWLEWSGKENSLGVSSGYQRTGGRLVSFKKNLWSEEECLLDRKVDWWIVFGECALRKSSHIAYMLL